MTHIKLYHCFLLYPCNIIMLAPFQKAYQYFDPATQVRDWKKDYPSIHALFAFVVMHPCYLLGYHDNSKLMSPGLCYLHIGWWVIQTRRRRNSNGCARRRGIGLSQAMHQSKWWCQYLMQRSNGNKMRKEGGKNDCLKMMGTLPYHAAK